MKKLFSKILAFAMVASIMSTAVFAEEMTYVEGVTLSNVSSVADYAIENDSEGNDFTLYSCEDYAVISLEQDVAWITLYYYREYGYSVPIGPGSVADGVDVAIYDVDAKIDGDVVMTLDELYKAHQAGEISDRQLDEQVCILAGGEITVIYEGVYGIYIIYSSESYDWAYFTFEVVDTDGIDSFVTAYNEEIAEETDVTEEVADEDVSEEIEEVATEEVIEETAEEIIEIVTGTAKSATATVIVDGEQVSFEAYEIDGNNYFKLRDLAAVASGSEKQFEVTWDGDLNAIGLISGESYTQVGGELDNGDGENKDYASTTATIYKDGEQVSFTAYEINGNNYFKLRDVCKAFDIGVTWDDATQTIGVDTSISYAE